VIKVRKVLRDRQVSQEQQGHKVQLVFRGPREKSVHRDHKGVPGSLEPLGHREPQVFKAQPVTKVRKVLRDRQVSRVSRDLPEPQVLKVLKGHRA
jgi:hypothetical protein